MIGKYHWLLTHCWELGNFRQTFLVKTLNEMSRTSQFSLWLLGTFLFCGCQGFGPNARIGTGIGGTTGALAGAAIGSHNGNSLEGALLGGALGSLAGATIGDANDELDYRNRLARQNAKTRTQQAAVTALQLVEMTSSGLNEDLIINQMQANGCAAPLSTNELIALKQRGVSDRVISTFQNFRGANVPQVRQTYLAPIVVPYDGHHPPRYFDGPQDCPHAPCPPRHRRANSFNFHVGF